MDVHKTRNLKLEKKNLNFEKLFAPLITPKLMAQGRRLLASPNFCKAKTERETYSSSKMLSIS